MAVKAFTPDQAAAYLSNKFSKSIGLFIAAMGSVQPSWNWLAPAVNALDNGLQPIAAGLVQQDDANPTTINIAAGRFSIQGVPLAYAGGTIDLATSNNKTVYVWLFNDSGAAAIGNAWSTVGWPAYAHIKLADVIVAAGGIAVTGAILDRRGEAALSDAGQFPPATLTAKGMVTMAAKIDANASTVSNPPTQAEVTSIQTTLNAVIAALKTANQMSNV